MPTMRKNAKRWYHYLMFWLWFQTNERMDPRIQLEQALEEAQEQQRRLKEQAANVIAHQKQTEIRLNRTMGDLEKANANARQAVLMADDAEKSGKTDEAARLTVSAEAFANRLIQVEKEVADLKTMHLAATEAANDAKGAVSQNAMVLQQKLAERQKLLSQLDQAKMQEQVNKTMSALSETVGEDVPTLNEVRDKIEARYAKAKGMAELNANSVESHMLEIEAATMQADAKDRLAQLKEQLGIAAPTAPEPVAIPAPADQQEAPAN
jgi:phage shock protein A